MFSFFDQSVLNLTKPIGENLAENSAIRAMVNRARNDRVDHFALMKEGRNGLFKRAISALKQIERAARLPNADKLSDMTDIEIESQNEEIAYAIKQHEGHVWRDHDDLLLIREQASLLANLAWEQQIHICNFNDKYLRLLEERKRLADMSHKPVYDSVDLISNTMKDIVDNTMKNLQEKINVLQETLNQRHDDMSRLLTPVDVTKIMDTMNKLREALIELSTRNADLVRSNNRFTLELSFMPTQMHDKIMQAKKSHSKIYFDQRTDPHHLVPGRPTEFAFERANRSRSIV
jgi:hypothetical protein